MLIFFFCLAAILAVVTFFVLQMPQFGKIPSGQRLARIQQSKNYRDGKFQNQTPTPDLSEGFSFWDILIAYTKKVEEKEPTKEISSLKIDLKNLPSGTPTLVWFGHSSYLLKLDDKTFLIDPVFSKHASPLSFFGKSYEGTNGYNVEDMPEIDYLVISHDHYDHLDYESITQLKPKVKHVITSLGTGEHLEHWGYSPSIISELDWWEQIQVDTTFKITSTPARHFSGRAFKRNQALWSSFVFETSTHRIFVGGDSGYDNHFEEIGKRFGGFDLAILECGQYNAMWHEIHTYPEELVMAAKHLKTKVVMPVHWAKFTLALHPWKEPIERMIAEAERQQLPYITPKIGEAIQIDKPHPTTKWWRE